jgi:hypothetical protein
MMSANDAAFVADECEAIRRELAAAEGIDGALRAALTERVGHLLERVDALAASDAQRAEVAASVRGAQRAEAARAERLERELMQVQAAILCASAAGVGEGLGLDTGAPYATACAPAWRHIATAHSKACDERREPAAAQAAEAELAEVLVQTKGDVMARAAAAADGAQALQLAQQATCGGLWMDHSSASEHMLSEELVQRQY